MIGLWKYNTATGYWKLERNCDDATAQTWLNIFKRDEPGTAFKLSRSKPKDTPAKDRRAALHRALDRVMDARAKDEETVRQMRSKLFAVRNQKEPASKHYPQQAKPGETVEQMRHRLFGYEPQDAPFSKANPVRALDKALDARRGRAGDADFVAAAERKLASAERREQAARERVSRATAARKNKGQRLQSSAEMSARSALNEASWAVHEAREALRKAREA